MLLLFASAFLLSTAYAASPSSVEAIFANYGWERVDPDHAVALAVFQWRLEHQWQGRRHTLAAALSYKRIRLPQKGYGRYGTLFDYPPAFDLYSMAFEVRWTSRWSRSWATTAVLRPALTGEEFADENRWPVRGEFLVLYKGLGLGVGRLEVSGGGVVAADECAPPVARLPLRGPVPALRVCAEGSAETDGALGGDYLPDRRRLGPLSTAALFPLGFGRGRGDVGGLVDD